MVVNGANGEQGSKPYGCGVSVSVHCSFRAHGQAVPCSYPAITGCHPDSGKPTVREERGACGNVGDGGMRHPPRLSKERVLETLRLRSYAPHFYPTATAYSVRSCLAPAARRA